MTGLEGGHGLQTAARSDRLIVQQEGRKVEDYDSRNADRSRVHIVILAVHAPFRTR